MLTLAPADLVPIEPTTSLASTAPGLPQVLDSFAGVVEAIDSNATVDEILHLVARKICELVACSRCGVYLKHSETGLYRGHAIESSSHGGDGPIQRLICGTEADGLTREILATKEPVLVHNAQNDPRTVRSIMRSFGVRSMLGVPMIVREDVVGILFLDNERVLHPFSHQQQAVAATFAQLAGVAILQAQRAVLLRSNMRTIARQNDLLRQCSAIEERLTRLVLEGGTLMDIAQAASELTGKPCTIHDRGFRRLAAGRPPGHDGPMPTVLEPDHRSRPEIATALAAFKPGRPAVIGASPCAGLLHRSLVMPVSLHGDSWGYFVLMEFGSRFTGLDTAVLRRAATAVAFELAVEQRAAVADLHARQTLVRDLINGMEDEAAIVRRAELLGFRVSSPQMVVLLGPEPGAGALPIDEVKDAWASLGYLEPMWATSVPHGAVAIVVELSEAASRAAALAQIKDATERLRAALARHPPAPVGHLRGLHRCGRLRAWLRGGHADPAVPDEPARIRRRRAVATGGR